MALQSSLTLSSNNAWFKTPATKMLGAFTAGLIAVVILLLSPLTSQSSQSVAKSCYNNVTTKQAPAANNAGRTTDKAQATSSSIFSLMPGRLSRFLQ